jgi:low affinity Fe/Cu permease
MATFKMDRIMGLVVICINVLLLIQSLYLLYAYNLTNRLFLFMYPNWVLLINALLAVIGNYTPILVIKNKIGLKTFLKTTLLFWLIVF